MSKQKYLDELRGRLRALPQNERLEAMEYYEGYIADADDEASAINELGSPAEVAAKILADHVTPEFRAVPRSESDKETVHESGQQEADYKANDKNKYTKIVRNPDGSLDGFKLAIAIIVAIFALPLAFPVVFSLVMIPLSLFIALFAVVFSFGVAAVAMMVAGIAGIIGSVIVLFSDAPSAIVIFGISLITLGIGALFFKLVTLIARGFGGIARMCAKGIRRVNMPNTNSEGV